MNIFSVKKSLYKTIEVVKKVFYTGDTHCLLHKVVVQAGWLYGCVRDILCVCMCVCL